VNSSFAKAGFVLQPEQPVEGQERGVGNYGLAGLLASSAGRGWHGLAAELRSHSGVIAWRNPRPDTEILGSMLIETLASSLAARLVQNHVGTLARDVSARAAQAGLDRRRLTHVLDYIGANLEGDLTLARLASIACLSRFHFSRAFKAAVGLSPHHYVSAKRLELAKQLLGRGASRWSKLR
jgi:AraC-like DNA-binding protein